MTNKTFDSLGLNVKTLGAIKNINYLAPMPVQGEVIPLILRGKDALVSAQTGSGKTAAFTIPLLDILTRNEDAKCLVVAPTRELAQQIQAVFRELAQGSEIKNALIVGGKMMVGQLKKLKMNPRFIIGTPGRLNDHIKRKSLDLSQTKYVIWDEMDRMLDLGFIHQIEDIMKNLPKERQTIMLSATFPKRIAALASKYLIDPVRVEIDAPNSVSTNVKQETIEVEGNAKLKELTKLLESFKKQQVLVFAKTQRTVGEMAKYLAKSGFAARALHGGLKQSKRDEVVKDFRAAAFNVLIATDVAARGLDIPKIAYVVNYELPQVPEEYIHRIGRTGRADKKGTAFTLLARADKSKWKQIKKFLQGDDGKMPAQIKWPAKAEQIIPTSGEPLQKPEKITRKTPPAQIKRKFGFKAEKEEINKKSVIKKIAVKKPAAIAPVKAEKKPEKKGAFKISYVGKKKEEKPKKYGRHQSKKWALIAERKYNHGKKFKKRKKR